MKLNKKNSLEKELETQLHSALDKYTGKSNNKINRKRIINIADKICKNIANELSLMPEVVNVVTVYECDNQKIICDIKYCHEPIDNVINIQVNTTSK